MIDELNTAIEELKYRFERSGDRSTLTLEGFPSVVFPDSAGAASAKWIRRLHADGAIHEPATVAALLAIRRLFGDRVRTIFDIGALYGYFALLARSLFSEARIVSFEMNPASYESLCLNVQANAGLGASPVNCVHAGLSDTSAPGRRVTVSGYALFEARGWQERVRNFRDRLRKKAKVKARSVKLDLLTVDDYCRETGASPDLVKIDAEGYQAKILPGARRTLEARRPILLLEFDREPKMRVFGTTNREVVRPLFDLGYRAWWCPGHRDPANRFEELTLDAMEDRHESNSLAVFVP